VIEWVKRVFGPGEIGPHVDAHALPLHLALGVRDAEGAEIVHAMLENADAPRVQADDDRSLLGTEFVGILVPAPVREPDHYQLVNRQGTRIGVILARRNRAGLCVDPILRVVGEQGTMSTVDWESRFVTSVSGWTSAVVRDADERVVGRVTTRRRGEVLDGDGRLLASSPDVRTRRDAHRHAPFDAYLVDPDRHVRVGLLYSGSPRRTRSLTSQREPRYSQATILRFDPDGDRRLRALALALWFCEEELTVRRQRAGGG